MEIKTKIALKLFCIILGIVMISAIIIHSRGMSEDKCIVKFITHVKGGNPLLQSEAMEIKITELYKSLEDKTCIVKWDDTTGYFYDG